MKVGIFEYRVGMVDPAINHETSYWNFCHFGVQMWNECMLNYSIGYFQIVPVGMGHFFVHLATLLFFVTGLKAPGWSVFSERGKQLGEMERKCPAAKACMYSEWLFQAFPKALFLNLALLECAISSCSVTADRGTFFQRVTKQNLLSESSLWHPTF